MEPPADSDRWLRAWDENENAWYWYDVHGDLDSVWETDDGAADDAKPETAALPENPPPPPPPPPQRSRAPARPADPPPSLPRASAGATAGGVRAAPLTFDAISGPEREEEEKEEEEEPLLEAACDCSCPEVRLHHPEAVPLGFAAVVLLAVAAVQLLGCHVGGGAMRAGAAPTLVAGSVFRSGTGEAVLQEREPCPGGIMLLSNASRAYPMNLVATFGAIAAALLWCAVAVLWHLAARHWRPPAYAKPGRGRGSGGGDGGGVRGGAVAAHYLALPLSLLGVAALIAHALVDGENNPRAADWTGASAFGLLWAALVAMDRLRPAVYRARLAAVGGGAAAAARRRMLGVCWPIGRYDRWRLGGRVALVCGGAATVVAWLLPASWRNGAAGARLQLVAVLSQACCVASLAPEIAAVDSSTEAAVRRPLPAYARVPAAGVEDD
jgi:hypothetical protein